MIRAYNIPDLRKAGLLPLHGMFFPSIYYPPLTMYPECSADSFFNDFSYNPSKPIALYIHIPFCMTKCTYCHWVTSIGNTKEEISRYLDYVEKEIDLWKQRLETEEITPSSILIGGGTPSILDPDQLKRFLSIIHSKFNVKKTRLQFSFEANPNNIISSEGSLLLKIMEEYGVNRISLGVQALDDHTLKLMNRPHSAAGAAAAINKIRDAGFESISIDLIYGYPGCTPDVWRETLEKALALNIDAYQLYRLRIVPHGDAVGEIKNEYTSHPEAFPYLEDIHLMKETARVISEENGFNENFRRIFSKGRQHISYYLNDYCCNLFNVLGIGVSSWSNFNDRLCLNTGDGIEKYYSYLDAETLPVDRGLIRSTNDSARRAIILPLKNCVFSDSLYTKTTGTTVHDAFSAKIEVLKNFDLVSEEKNKIFLTQKGRFFADEVVMQFYDHRYLPFSRNAYAAGPLNPYND